MQAYLAGQDVTLSIQLVSDDGTPIVASAVEYRLLNQDDVELIVKTPLATFNPSDPEAVVTISAAQNSLVSAVRELRVVELFLTTDSGVIALSSEYIVESTTILVSGVNSFQSYNAALMVGFETPNIEAWNEATKGARINALIAARRNIGKLYLRYVGDSEMTRIISPFDDGSITSLTALQFDELPDEMKDAVRRAQVIEADYLLGGDPNGDIRRAGVMSSTVGESSQFFRTAKPYEGPVCKRVYQELSKYIVRINRIGRA